MIPSWKRIFWLKTIPDLLLGFFLWLMVADPAVALIVALMEVK